MPSLYGESEDASTDQASTCDGVRCSKGRPWVDVDSTGSTRPTQPASTLSNASRRPEGRNDVAKQEEEIEEEVGTKIFLDNLAIISSKCKLLDYLCLRNLKFSSSQETFPSQVPSTPLEFRFLTSLQLNNNSFSHCPKETLKYILGNSPDLERIHIRFDTTSFFFNDFLHDVLSWKFFGFYHRYTFIYISVVYYKYLIILL